MIIKDDFLKKIRSVFDLNIYEAKIWTALLSKGTAAAGEISDISNVPRSRTYDVLETLEKRGFIIMKLGKPIRYLAISPEDILKRLKKKVENETVSKIDSLEKVRSTELFHEIELLHKNGIANVKTEDISASIRGRNNVYNQLEELLKDAKKSVTLVTTQNGLARKTEILRNIFKKLSQNNVSIRIASKAPLNNKELITEVKKYAELRELKDMEARFIIIDSKDIVFLVNDDNKNEEDHAIWISTPFFASAIETMFNAIWQKLPEVK